MQLPIDPYLDRIRETLLNSNSLVLTAAPGSGKTTKVPLSLLNNVSAEGRIIVLQPRRLACKLVASFLAELRGEALGDFIGYRVRFESKESKQTRLLFMTDGMFLRYLQSNPTLNSVACVVQDEFHERTLNSDLAFALIRKVQLDKNTNLKHLVMSATLDATRISEKLDCEWIDVPGVTFPVESQFFPIKMKETSHSHLLRALNSLYQTLALKKEQPGNILVFLSGVREIREACSFLRTSELVKNENFDVLPLYADLNRADQKKVFSAKQTQFKIILSTNVAETSVTIPNLVAVLDFGFHKEASFSTWNGLPSLTKVRISKASARQRSGRAGRTRKGYCIRLYSEADFASFAAHERSQIRKLDLADFMLMVGSILENDTKVIGLKKVFESLPWLENPEAKNIEQAVNLLVDLKMIDKEFHLTQLGKKSSRMPLHPRLAAVALKGQECDIPKLALLLCALISEGGVLDRNYTQRVSFHCDATFQLGLLLERKILDSDFIKLKPGKVDQIWRNFLNLNRSKVSKRDFESLEPNLIGQCLFAGFFDQVARVQPKSEKLLSRKEDRLGGQQRILFAFCKGRGGTLSQQSGVNRSRFLIAIDAIEDPKQRNRGAGISINMATSLDEKILVDSGNSLIETKIEFSKRKPGQQVKRTYYGNLLVAETEIIKIEKSDAEEGENLIEKFKKDFPKVYCDPAYYFNLEKKIECALASGQTPNVPKIEGDFLELLALEEVEGLKTLEELKKSSIQEKYMTLVDYKTLKNFEKNFPDFFVLPNGRRLKIDYADPSKPKVSSRIQDFYFCKTHPTIFGGRVSLLLELLAPSRRPIQLTADLENFWTGSYVQIKKEMKARYPKHDWPEPSELPYV